MFNKFCGLCSRVLSSLAVSGLRISHRKYCRSLTQNTQVLKKSKNVPDEFVTLPNSYSKQLTICELCWDESMTHTKLKLTAMIIGLAKYFQ